MPGGAWRCLAVPGGAWRSGAWRCLVVPGGAGEAVCGAEASITVVSRADFFTFCVCTLLYTVSHMYDHHRTTAPDASHSRTHDMQRPLLPPVTVLLTARGSKTESERGEERRGVRETGPRGPSGPSMQQGWRARARTHGCPKLARAQTALPDTAALSASVGGRERSIDDDNSTTAATSMRPMTTSAMATMDTLTAVARRAEHHADASGTDPTRTGKWHSL